MHLPLFVVFGTWSFAPALALVIAPAIAPILCVFTLLLPLPGCCLYSVVSFTHPTPEYKFHPNRMC